MIDWDYERSRCWQPGTLEEFADAHADLHRVPSEESIVKAKLKKQKMTGAVDPIPTVPAQLSERMIRFATIVARQDQSAAMQVDGFAAEVAELEAERDTLSQQLEDARKELEELRDAIAPFRGTPEDEGLWQSSRSFVDAVRNLREVEDTFNRHTALVTALRTLRTEFHPQSRIVARLDRVLALYSGKE